MKVVAFIENPDVIRKILKYLGVWDIKRKPSPVANAPSIKSDSDYIPSVDDYVIDSDYPLNAYFQ